MIEWTEKFNTNVQSIDDDHKFLVVLLNSFSQMVEDGASKDRLDGAIEALRDYAFNHFKREELLMLVSTYNHFEPHKKTHENFTRTVDALQSLFALSPTMIDISGVIKFLSDWLVNHILVSDHDYIEQMKSRADVVLLVEESLRHTLTCSL